MADCGADHYLMVARIRDRMAENKQTMQKSDTERFNPKKLKEVEDMKQNRVET
jgi:hypothetical protein